MGDLQKLLQNRAQVRFVVPNERLHKHRAAADKEYPPEFSRLLQPLRPKGLHIKTLLLQRSSGILDRLPCLGRNGHQTVIFEIPNAQWFHFSERDLTLWNRWTDWIDCVLAGERLEQQRNIIDGARHRSNSTQNRERTHASRQVAVSGDSSRRWLQRADASEVRGHANRASTVAAEAAAR